MLGSSKIGELGVITLLIRDITFRYQNVYAITIHQRYRWTDELTIYDSNTALCVASHGNNGNWS